MPDNPTKAQAIALPDHRLLEIEGRDALAFAQAQFMNDLTPLADGQWQWIGWLTPKGRVVALFALLRLDARTLWLLLPDFAPADLATAHVLNAGRRAEAISGAERVDVPPDTDEADRPGRTRRGPRA